MNFNELTEAYWDRFNKFLLQIEIKCASRNKKMKIEQSPSYLEEVIIPICQSLSDRICIKIPNPQTYYPVKGYYRIKVGVTTVGGFPVPENGDCNIYFIPMKNANPIGEKQLATNTEELAQLIINQLKAEKRQAILK